MASGIVATLARRSVTYSSCCISRRSLFRSNNDHYYYHVQSLYLSTQSFTKQPSTTTPPILFTQDFFIAKYQFSPETASKLASVSARLRNPQNPDVFLSFLKECGFLDTHLERIVNHYTHLLSSSPETSVKPKFKIFQDLGFSAAEATEIITRDPTVLLYQPKRIIHSLSVYRRLLGSNDNVIRLVKKFSGLLFADPEKTILPNIQFLKTCGIPHEQISRLIYTFPGFFLMSPENMRRGVQKADEMGVDRTSRLFIYAVEAVSTMPDETLKLKLKTFRDFGFSEDDILRLFRSYPLVIAVSTRKMKEVIEVLLETGKYDMSCIIKNPTSFTRSVEKRYKPRLEVLKALERKSLISKWPGLSVLGSITDKMFYEKFVAPNINEVGKDFIAKIGLTGEPETATALKTS